jgi:hypothetical protein
MRGVNRVMLIGNLGKDPDVQFLDGNIAVAKFPLATTETFKDRSGKLVSQTEWHTVGIANRMAHGSTLARPGRTSAKIPAQRQPGVHRRAPAHPQLGRQGSQPQVCY